MRADVREMLTPDPRDAVGEMRPHPYPTLAASAHAFDTILETCNHSTLADSE
jgi:hypothetical protein